MFCFESGLINLMYVCLVVTDSPLGGACKHIHNAAHPGLSLQIRDSLETLNQAQEFPPDASNTCPDQQICDTANSSNSPPFLKRHIACAIVRWGRANSIVGQTTHKVAQESQQQGHGHRGCIERDSHCQKCSIHCTNMCSTTGKEVVAVEVDKRQDNSGQACRHTPNQSGNSASEPLDETHGIEVTCLGKET